MNKILSLYANGHARDKAWGYKPDKLVETRAIHFAKTRHRSIDWWATIGFAPYAKSALENGDTDSVCFFMVSVVSAAIREEIDPEEAVAVFCKLCGTNPVTMTRKRFRMGLAEFVKETTETIRDQNAWWENQKRGN